MQEEAGRFAQIWMVCLPPYSLKSRLISRTHKPQPMAGNSKRMTVIRDLWRPYEIQISASMNEVLLEYTCSFTCYLPLSF